MNKQIKNLLKNCSLFRGKVNGFTLAEALITIGIIGIVAAILMNTLFAEISEKVNSTREANIAQKITKAIELMVARGDYRRFDDTIDFVNALSKYLKISKICDSEHIADCWPSKEITNAEGDTYQVKNAKTGTELFTGYLSNNAAFVMADGASIIMSYDPSANLPTMRTYKPKTKTLPVGGGKSNDFAYTTEITDGIDFVMDVNGKEGPNAETETSGTYHDIRSFRRAAFSRMTPTASGEPICTVRVTGMCVYVLTGYGPLDCSNTKNAEFCTGVASTVDVSYMAGARKACKEKSMRLASVDVAKSLKGSTDKIPNKEYLSDTPNNTTGVNTTYSWVKHGVYLPALCYSYE